MREGALISRLYHKRAAFASAIFDLDGTLLDSMHVWDRVDREFFASRGMTMPDDYPDAVRAMSFRETARYTIARFGLDQDEQSIMEEWRALARAEYECRVEMKSGALEYLQRLKGHGVALATATSLQPDLAAAALIRCGAYGLFDAMCGTHETARGKESPDVFLLAADRLGAAPASCVAFEDVLEACASARAAGMMVCCVRDASSARSERELREVSDWLIDDFSDAPMPI